MKKHATISLDIVRNIKRILKGYDFKAINNYELTEIKKENLTDYMMYLLEIFPKSGFYDYNGKIFYMLDKNSGFAISGIVSDFMTIFERTMFLHLDKNFLKGRNSSDLKYYEYNYLNNQISEEDYKNGVIRLYNISGLKENDYIRCRGFLTNYIPRIHLNTEFNLVEN